MEGVKVSLKYNGKLIATAKELRKNMTKQESRLWYDCLSRYPVRFQRQKTISGFIVDFYCHSAKLVIEVDGSQHYSDEGLIYDEERTKILNGYGIRVIRFLNKEVDNSFSEVCSKIDEEVKARLPQSP